jgi:ribonucleoside-triphosphate reductase
VGHLHPTSKEISYVTFRTPAAQFVYTRTYSRWIESDGRRETWDETVDRYLRFIQTSEYGPKIPRDVIAMIGDLIRAQKIMPSMRAMWAAGPAAAADHTTLYNCAFVVVDSIEAFSEILYILMCGTGIGFRVLAEDVAKLPVVPFGRNTEVQLYGVEDSRAGWADSVRALIESLYRAESIAFNYDRIRPRGARLVTMGGRASGPDPLIRLHDFIRKTFDGAWGRRLTPLECHDICNMIAEIVVVGGVRRSSQISLSDLNDQEMRDAKSGHYPFYRAMANNSAVYETRPTDETFWAEWEALAASGTGERGIFNLEAARHQAPERRNRDQIEGVNPCGEISLRDMGFCNLSEVVVRVEDSMRSLREKVYYATWIGAIQSTFTNFPYLRPEWERNCKDERLLGVSLTGQMDAPDLLTRENLKALKEVALAAARDAARQLGINMPAAVTCVKPSGTVSQVVDSASGMHPRYAPYYIRRYRISSTDPLYRLMRDQGVAFEPEVGQGPEYGHSDEEVQTWVCEFPVASPRGALTRHDISALDQLNHYKLLMEAWCEHNASCTVYVDEHEWTAVGEWVLENWKIVNGISFLPKTNHSYRLAPYEDLTRDRYHYLMTFVPQIDYSQLGTYETEDATSGSKELACSGGSCEIE